MMEQDARVMTMMLVEQREQGVDERAQRSHSRKRGAPASAEAGAKRAAPAVAIMTNKEVQAQQIRARELADMALSNIQALASAAHTFGAAAQAASKGAALASLDDVNQDLQGGIDSLCAYAPIVVRLSSVLLDKLSHVQAAHKRTVDAKAKEALGKAVAAMQED
jgi:hypothetical protein